MVTFETKVYENDWQYVLRGNYLETMIAGCCYNFEKKLLFINNVKDIKKVKKYADKKVKAGIIDEYFIVDEYASEALNHFDIDQDSFGTGYYYSIAELVSIYLCDTDYLLHFSGDSFMSANGNDWITPAIEIFKSRTDVIVANPTWNSAYHEAKSESFGEEDGFYLGYGFSDQCYLIKVEVFKQKIYNEKHIDSQRYPGYGGELFEKRVDSFMRNYQRYRITSKHASYIHKNFNQGKWFRMKNNLSFGKLVNERFAQ